MEPKIWIAYLLAAVGVSLIVLGAWMTLREWQRAMSDPASAQRKALSAGPLSGLAKVLEALRHYPVGQRLIVFGIVVLLITAALFGIG